MNVSVTIGWWLIPFLVGLVAFTWAFPRRNSERSDGSLFGDMSYVLGFTLRSLLALVVSLVALLVWALIT